jgi:sugar phosphate isomerase/epimerase
MINLAFSTNAFKKNTLDEAIDTIAGIGYRGVELMADLHHAYPPIMDEPRRAHTRQRIATPGLVVSNVNAFTLFACGDTYHENGQPPAGWAAHRHDAHARARRRAVRGRTREGRAAREAAGRDPCR